MTIYVTVLGIGLTYCAWSFLQAPGLNIYGTGKHFFTLELKSRHRYGINYFHSHSTRILKSLNGMAQVEIQVF